MVDWSSSVFSTSKIFIIMSSLHKVSLWLATSVLLWVGAFQAFGQSDGFTANGAPVVEDAGDDGAVAVTFKPSRRGKYFFIVVQAGPTNGGPDPASYTDSRTVVNSFNQPPLLIGDHPVITRDQRRMRNSRRVSFTIPDLPSGDYRFFLVLRDNGVNVGNVALPSVIGELQNVGFSVCSPPSFSSSVSDGAGGDVGGEPVVHIDGHVRDAVFSFGANNLGQYLYAVFSYSETSHISNSRVYAVVADGAGPPEGTRVLAAGSGAITPHALQTINVGLLPAGRVEFRLLIVPTSCSYELYRSSFFSVEGTVQDAAYFDVPPAVTGNSDADDQVVTFTPYGGPSGNTYHYLVVSSCAQDAIVGNDIVAGNVRGCVSGGGSYTAGQAVTFSIAQGTLPVGDHRLYVSLEDANGDDVVTEFVDFQIEANELRILRDENRRLEFDVSDLESRLRHMQEGFADSVLCEKNPRHLSESCTCWRQCLYADNQYYR